MANFTRLEKIGGGGQGEVFRGQSDSGTLVAIKYLFPQVGVDDDGRDHLKRFEREISCQTELDHIGIMEILAIGLDSKPPHFVMPLADYSLRDSLIASPDGLEEDEAVGLFLKVLAAVSYAHNEGVLHRDLKPENILMISGEPRISDFGLGRRLFSGSTTLTVTNAGLGTLQYSAPEQLRDAHTVDVRADVFALGRIFYEILCGEMAFYGMDLDKIPARFRYIVLRSTYVDIEKRFTSVSEMSREIALLGNGDEWLQPGSERATSLITKISDGDSTAVPELTRLLLEHPDDGQLFLRVLPYAPIGVLAQVALQQPDDFLHIVRSFDIHADARHSFSFTDTLADFMLAVLAATTNIEVSEIVFSRLLQLGYAHNRWYVGNRFVEAAVGAMQKEPMYAAIIASILRGNPAGAQFVKGDMTRRALPKAVLQALAA